MNIRPSSLPMLAECPKFEGQESAATQAGTERHEAMADYFEGKLPDELDENAESGIERHKKLRDFLLSGDDDSFKDANPEFRESLIWAAGYIKTRAPMMQHELSVEKRREIVLPNGIPLKGTPDIVCGDQLFDLKWRTRDYTPQMAAYSLMVIEEGNHDVIHTHLLFGQPETIRMQSFDAGKAWGIIKPILQHVNEAFATANPCEYCGWCKHNMTCKALQEQINIAIASNPEWELEQWHSSKIDNAKDMGKALKIARTLKPWCESTEKHAKDLAVRLGIIAEDFEMKHRQGARFIDDLVEAFKNSGMPQDEFLKICDVKLKPLFTSYAEFHGLKASQAEKELMGKLGDAVKRREPTVMLQRIKPKTTKKD